MFCVTSFKQQLLEQQLCGAASWGCRDKRELPTHRQTHVWRNMYLRKRMEILFSTEDFLCLLEQPDYFADHVLF